MIKDISIDRIRPHKIWKLLHQWHATKNKKNHLNILFIEQFSPIVYLQTGDLAKLEVRFILCKSISSIFQILKSIKWLEYHKGSCKVVSKLFLIYVGNRFPFFRTLRIDWYQNFQKIRSKSWSKGIAKKKSLEKCTFDLEKDGNRNFC